MVLDHCEVKTVAPHREDILKMLVNLILKFFMAAVRSCWLY